MGRRSRKRGSLAADEGSPGSSRAERDAARRRRRAAAAHEPGHRRGPGRSDERPAAPWGSFPLVELVVLVALVLIVAGVIVWGDRGRVMLVAGLALGSLAGLELSIREHLAGFRSHSTLLAGSAAIATMVIVFFASGSAGPSRLLLFGAGLVVFALAFWACRELFKRRSGGLGFR